VLTHRPDCAFTAAVTQVVTTGGLVIYSVTPEQDAALKELADATEAYRRICEQVKQRAQTNIESVDVAIIHPGFGHQMLGECARFEQRFRSAIAACHRLRLDDPINAVIRQPALVWTHVFKVVG
jgi:hypothetical protein